MSKKIKSKQTGVGLIPSKWEKFFITAGVGSDAATARGSERGKSIRFGNFLSRFVGRQVLISVKGRTGKATLRMVEGRARKKQYHFEIAWDDKAPTEKKNVKTSKPTSKAESQPRKSKTNIRKVD